jgi:hypothetical protein
MGSSTGTINVIALDLSHEEVIKAVAKMTDEDPLYRLVINIYLSAWRDIVLDKAVDAEEDFVNAMDTLYHTELYELGDIDELEDSMVRMCVNSLPVRVNLDYDVLKATLATGMVLYHGCCDDLAGIQYVPALRMRAIAGELTALLKRYL